MVLAESGFGKTTSIGKNDKLGIKGLNPKETLIIQPTSKGLPFPGNKINYTKLSKGPNGEIIGNILFNKDTTKTLAFVQMIMAKRPEIKNFVFDDFNFYMQDFYMKESKNTKKNVFKTFEEIGGQTSDFFDIFDMIDASGKNVIVFAHTEIYEDIDERPKYKIKTVGKMVDTYVTPEGRFETVLLGKTVFNKESKKVSKYFVTEDDGVYNGKSPFGMFPRYTPNDMGFILECIEAFNTGEPMPEGGLETI